ncbi:MAG: twin-arginine translocase TatA/TatE family subunit [Paludibacteraceae bacterium]|nr:twin-arginine translocase TatA/TatE family subunit [Paludibacteraceae bacterium]MBR2260237.1 twin-arginine translocase TatA/TatE family subunit [Paludibacteraceae bacterium]MEE3483827.1 twin-arginine translocase TatA/TatE family subunit [Bacteroidales bacterium]
MNTLHILLFGNIGFSEILVIALVVLLLFGGKKIPELMNGLGKGIKSFKDGMNNKSTDTKEDDKENNEQKEA